MRNATFYLEQEVTVIKRWEINDPDIRTDDDAVEYIENTQPEADETDEVDWGTIVVTDSEPGARDYNVTLSVLVEAEDQSSAENIASDINSRTWESNTAVIESNVISVEEFNEC